MRLLSTNRLVISALFAFSSVVSAAADQFSPLPLSLPTGSSSTGVPSAQYWQQQVNYSIQAELFPDSATLSASAQIQYQNNSPWPLTELWFELPLNRFLPDSISTALHGEGSGSAGVRQIAFFAKKQPLPLLPKTALCYVQTGDEAKCRELFEGGYNVSGELQSAPELQRYYPDFASLLQAGFADWAAKIYGPLVQAPIAQQNKDANR